MRSASATRSVPPVAFETAGASGEASSPAGFAHSERLVDCHEPAASPPTIRERHGMAESGLGWEGKPVTGFEPATY
jgi:hypothetical protein